MATAVPPATTSTAGADEQQSATAPTAATAATGEVSSMASPAISTTLNLRTIVETKLLEPYNYLEKTPGKNIRSRLIRAFDKWLAVPPEIMKDIIKVIQELHTASLMIDDIEDNSKMRRGVPATHLIYGLPATINTANYAYFLALERCVKMNNAAATHHFVEELLNLHRGQGLDIYWRDNYICPTEDEYMQMVRDKTGGLFRLCIKMMQEFSTNKQDFIPLVNAIGLLFQIMDDYINLQSAKYMKNKSFCEDLTEGKFSFPIIHCIRSQPDDSRLLNILKQRPTDESIKMYAVEHMRSTGSFEYTKRVIGDLYRKTLAEVEKMGGNHEMVVLINDIYRQVLDGDLTLSA